MIRKDQHGITLIELLITLTILSIVGVLIWSVFSQGTKFSSQAMTKNAMQQEANIIISSLKKIHQTSSSYDIVSNDCSIKVKTEKKTEVFEHPQLCFETDNNISAVDPNLEDISIKLTIKDKNDTHNQISIGTLLYRLKSGD